MRASRWRSTSGTAGKVAGTVNCPDTPGQSGDLDQTHQLINLVVPRDHGITKPLSVFPSKTRYLPWNGPCSSWLRRNKRNHEIPPIANHFTGLAAITRAILLSSSMTTAQGPRRETPVAAQSQKVTSLTAIEKGHGVITFPIEELEVTSVLVVLRENGTMLLALFSDLQLQADGIWSVSPVSPQEIDLTINGRAVGGEVTGSGKLFLREDLKSFKRITFKGQTCIGSNITVTFVADAAKQPEDRSSP